MEPGRPALRRDCRRRLRAFGPDCIEAANLIERLEQRVKDNAEMFFDAGKHLGEMMLERDEARRKLRIVEASNDRMAKALDYGGKDE